MSALGGMWISFECLCDPPKRLTSDGVKRCDDCGIEIVYGHELFRREPLRLVRDHDDDTTEGATA